MEKKRISQDQWEYLFERKDETIFSNISDDKAFVENILFFEDFFYSDSFAISFENCEFEGKASFHACSFQSDVYFTNCIFKRELYIGELKSKYKISFLDSTIEETAVFCENTIYRLELNLKYAKKIIFDGRSSIGYIQIGGKDRNKYGTIHLNIGPDLERFEINHTEIDDLYFGYSTLDAELILANSYLEKVKIENFRNAGSLKFLNCQSRKSKDSSILINQSNLGKAEFFNVTNSVLFECIFINCSWAKRNLISRVEHFSPALGVPEETTDEVLAENLKDVFKQVKTSFARQGDYVQEQFFHGLEMNAYYKSLSFKGAFWTKIILRLSFWTSDYGQSFIRPLLLIIVVNSFIFFGMFLLHATEYSSYDLRNLSNYFNTAASVLNFMNPLHKIKDNLTGLPFVLDTTGRIISSYLIYNMIRSTRRFVK